MVVRVKYVFGLARGVDGRDEMRLELPGGATVFEAMQRLGVSTLELHAAVNGESAPDGTILRDGDEVTLIPAIQGGRGESLMRFSMIASIAALLGAVALAAPPEALAQNRALPRGGVSVPSGGQDVRIVTPGAPPTRVTIEPVPGAAGAFRPDGAPVRGFGSVPSFSRETHITIDRGGTRQEIQIFSNGPASETPIVIVP
jgi:sulfur carrier protein ThiS